MFWNFDFCFQIVDEIESGIRLSAAFSVFYELREYKLFANNQERAFNLLLHVFFYVVSV